MNRKNAQLLAALISGLCLLFCSVAAGETAAFTSTPAPTDTPVPAPTFVQTVSPADAGITQSAIADDGVLRVYLKSLAAPNHLTLTLDGEYTVENDAGFRFTRGTQILLSEGDSRIYLSVGGLTLDMGRALTLTRQATNASSNGLIIAEAERQTLYAGDLAVSLEEGGGLRAVLSINIEDYLCGVVAYEMSDSWPLEALKAQAVAARTYAMQRKWSAGKRDYDVVDTTADQVYKGYDADYANVIQAVRTTAGVVGSYKGAFATCYYTASNGGQTALANDIWGGDGDYGYLEMKDDPYDLENANSLVNSISISADVHESASLRNMITDALISTAQAQGVNTEGMALEAVESITPTEPAHANSRMYTKLSFHVTASVPEIVYLPGEGDVGAPGASMDSAAGNAVLSGIDYLRRMQLLSPYEPTEQRRVLSDGFDVTLSVYEQIKNGLSLGLNSGDYELVSVTGDAQTGFTIEMRRFGHGVGMSQRGAQTMAGSYNMSYTQILNFYYPGLTLELIEWNTPTLIALDALPASVGYGRPEPTATPTPAPLPALADGEYYATVTLSDSSSNLNMRAEASTTAQVVTQLTNGNRLIVSGTADAEGWVAVHTAEVSGYVKLEYLTAE